MFLPLKINKWNYKYYSLYRIMILIADTTRIVITKLINSVSGLLKAYWKYYTLYDVYNVNPNQIVSTNLDWSKKQYNKTLKK